MVTLRSRSTPLVGSTPTTLSTASERHALALPPGCRRHSQRLPPVAEPPVLVKIAFISPASPFMPPPSGQGHGSARHTIVTSSDT
jgi:hypothetical protein